MDESSIGICREPISFRNYRSATRPQRRPIAQYGRRRGSASRSGKPSPRFENADSITFVLLKLIFYTMLAEVVHFQ
jgi:hypothetical protein